MTTRGITAAMPGSDLPQNKVEDEVAPPVVTPVVEEPVVTPVVPAIEDEDDDEDDFLEDELQEYRPFTVEDMDPAMPLWEGGPNAGQIIKWKDEFGEVYFTSINVDEHIIWRCIGRGEWRAIERNFEEALERQSQADAMMDKQEAVTEMCVLFPHITKQSMMRMKAGIPALIYQQVLEASGFVSIDVRQL